MGRYAGHRSLVSLFFLGGNDGNNLIVPKDAAEYSRYQAARPSLAFAKADLRTITPANGAAVYGLHPNLARLQAAFNAGTASMVANVGPVALPTTVELLQQISHPRPTHLQSHSDQQDAWASALAIPSMFSPSLQRSGWGGRLSDRIGALNAQVAGRAYPATTHLGGRSLFSAGAVAPLVTSGTGELAFASFANPQLEALRRSGLSQVAKITNGHALEQEAGMLFTGAIELSDARAAARAAAWAQLPHRVEIEALVAGLPTTWSLPGQVLAVLQDIVAAATPKAAQGLGLRRQLFSIGLGGFDTHTGQRAAQDGLFAQVDAAVHVFLRGLELIELDWPHGLAPQSTLFTMSDFGRTLVENSDAGTDHAWGNHMFVVGKQVAGKMLHGRFPKLDVATSPDALDHEGRWVPSLSVEQYVRDLALWLGVSGAEAAEIFPNLADYVAFATETGMPGIYRQQRLPLMRAD
ncbi:MAG: DUF1501 domain-containing protein [Kofleriaceae bacterium]